jgi:cell wall-associated NlpC family hydrolase
VAGERFSGVALGSIAAGALFVYAGIKGYSIPNTIKALITGKSPAAQTQATPVSGSVQASTTALTTATGSASGSAISADAMKYVGQGYIYGGPSTPGKWDCSSFVSYVLGHDLGLPVPGGTWASVTANGTQHGPASGSYMSFGSSVPLAQAQPGDLVATADHMGIVTGGGQMVSAQNPQLGTGVGGYTSGFPGGTPVCRRVG